MTILFTGIVLAAVFLATMLQFFIPPLPGPWVDGARVLLLPVVMFYGTLALPFWAMLIVVFAAGFFWDALTLQPVQTITGESLLEISIGWSIVLYALLGSIMSGLRPLFLRGRWELHCLLSGLFTAVIVLAEYFILAFRRGTLQVGHEAWGRAVGAGIAATVAAPLVFLALNWIADWIGYHSRPAGKGEKS